MLEPLPQKQSGDEETLQFLKREEVRTMAKDIARLREEEARKERNRISKIIEEPKKAQADARTPQPQPVLQTREEAPKPSLMPHTEGQKPVFLKARTRSEKIIIRVIVIGILLFIALNGLMFGYWYLIRKKTVEIVPNQEPAPSLDIGVEEQTPPPPPPQTPIPAIFFETPQEKIIDLGSTDSLAALLSDALKEEYPQGFTRIRLRETGSTAFLTLREFLNGAAITMPESLLSLLKDDFMLFVYSSPVRSRLGIIAEATQTEGVQDMLRSWETTMEQDTKPLWEIVGQKGSAYAPFFRQSVHQNTLVRFQTFSVLDFGVVYTFFDSKIILTTSFESLTKAVDLIIQSRQ